MRLIERRTRGAMTQPAPEARVESVRTVNISQARRDGPTRWTVALVMAAIDDHEQGVFDASGRLGDAMERDDRIRGCITTRVNALGAANGVDFGIEPPEGQSDQLARRVDAWWWPCMPDATLLGIARDMLKLGFHLSRIHWKLSEREWRPVRLERWHPSHVRYDETRQRWLARTADAEVVVELDDPNWLLVLPGGDTSWMAGAVRALGLAYVMRQFNWRDWARFGERHGLPIIAITEPNDADDKAVKAFYSSVQRMGSTGIIRLPQNNTGQGFGMEMIEAKDTAHATFQAFRTDLDASIAVTLLGQNLTTEVKGGSFAATTAHDRIRGDYLRADAETLATALRDQLIVRWGRFNVPGWRDELAPWPTWDTTAPPDRAQESETLGKVATAVQVFQSTGMPVDYAELFRRVGVPILKGQDPNVVEPPQPAPAPAGGDARAQARLRSGASAAANTGFVAGQLYADDLVDEGQKAARAASLSFIEELLEIVDQGADYERLREAVLAHYEGAAPPHEVRAILEKVLVLAQLGGQASVLEDQ